MTPEPTSPALSNAITAAPAITREPRDSAGPSALTRLGLVVLSAALLRVAFPPFHLPALSLLAVAPLLLALEGLRPRQAAVVGLTWGAVSGAANTHWLIEVFRGGGGGALFALTPFCWLLMGVFGALYGVGHALASRRGNVALAVVGPALWITIEWLRSEPSPLPFAWFTLGHALANSEWFRQDADLAGVYGLSLLSYATSFTLVRAWQLRRDGRGFVLALFAVVIPLLFWVRGSNVLGTAPPLGTVPEGHHALRVVVVQIESPPWSPLTEKVTLTRDAIAAAKGPVDLVVWPETTVSDDVFRKSAVRTEVENVAALTSGAFITGTFERVGEGSWFNSALLVAPSGSTIGVYHKRVPVPFAEMSAVAGTDSPVFDVACARSTDTTKVGVFICYDGTFPFVARELVRNGAQLLVTPSMDMKEWGEIQHLEHASFYPLRACELRRPIARASSSGVSLILDAWGRELARIPSFDPGARSAVVVPETEMTIYVLFGWLLPYVALALVVLGAGLGFARRTRS